MTGLTIVNVPFEKSQCLVFCGYCIYLNSKCGVQNCSILGSGWLPQRATAAPLKHGTCASEKTVPGCLCCKQLLSETAGYMDLLADGKPYVRFSIFLGFWVLGFGWVVFFLGWVG